MLTQIVFVVGTAWVGVAAKLGPSQGVFWLLAILLFYFPLATVVIYLNRLMPLEGGLYQWARLGFNDFTGFMVASNLWLLGITVMAGTGLIVATNPSYAIGPGAAWMPGSKWFVSLINSVLVVSLVLVTLRGLALGKWIHNAGAVMLMVIYAALIIIPFVSPARLAAGSYHPLAIAMPVVSLFSLNIFSKMALGALSGFEYVAILAGETRAPARNVGLSVLIAAPVIALMFILGTSSVLAFVQNNKIDLIGPVPQVLSLGFHSYGFVSLIVSVSILMLLGRSIALVSIYFIGNTRLPMVAGWDNLLPSWFARLHSKYKTPVNSIIFVGLVTLAFALASLIGVGEQEAFQLLENAAGVFYAIAYMILFAIPIFGLKALGVRTPLWLQLVAGCGFLVSLLYAVLTIVPIVEVESRLSFAMKIIVVTAAANAIGAGIFAAGKRSKEG